LLLGAGVIRPIFSGDTMPLQNPWGKLQGCSFDACSRPKLAASATKSRLETASRQFSQPNGARPMDRQYYLYQIRLDGTDRYLIWYTDDQDGFLLCAEARACCFDSAESARAFTAREQVNVGPDPAVLDLDEVQKWLEAATIDDVDCVLLLNAWNTFTDMAASTGRTFEPPDLDRIYEKLFWGNNLPPVTPPGEHFTPAWTDDEIRQLAQVMSNGLELMRSALPTAGDAG